MTTPDAYDLLHVREGLDNDERQVQETVGRFVDERAPPITSEAFDHHRVPTEVILAMATGEAIGCVGLSEPEGGTDTGRWSRAAKRPPQRGERAI